METSLSAPEIYGQFMMDVQKMGALQQRMLFESMHNPMDQAEPMVGPPPPLIPTQELPPLIPIK